MIQYLYIAAGGAVGAMLRFAVSNSVHTWLSRGFPYGTLLVNTVGSVLMGFLYVFIIERAEFDPAWRSALMIGFLGAFTTFSTFSIETLNLLESQEYMKAVSNIFFSVLLCVSGCWLGLLLGRQM